MTGEVMNQSATTAKVISILQNEPQIQSEESLSNYSFYRSERVTTDLLEMVWDHTHDGMLLTDSDGTIVAVNEAFCAMSGMNEPDLVNLPFIVFLHHTIDRGVVMEEYKRQVKERSLTQRYETELHFSGGRRMDAEVITSVLVDSADEVFVLTEYRDIGERKRWDESLRRSENQYRALFQNSVLPLYTSSVEGKLTNANTAMMRLLDYDTVDELLSLDLARDVYLHADQRKRFYEDLRSGRLSGPVELMLKKRNGAVIVVLAHTRTLRDATGAVSGFEGALEDITERKEMEQQIQATIRSLEATKEELTRSNAQKDKLLAVIAHDLRSPFGSILGFCDLLKNDFQSLTDKEKLEYIGFINDAAQQQLALVNSLLDWSKLETGRVRVNPAPVNVRTVAGEVVSALLGLAHRHKVTLRSAVPEGTTVTADEALFRQLLMNLTGNALKFTPAGGTVELGVAIDTSSGTVLTVTDTGTGIPAEDLPKLFKVEEKYTREGLHGEAGTGLGLPMCAEIMKQHNGTIEVRSGAGEGTEFRLTFPKTSAPCCGTVLIVDDQQGNRLILSRFMKRLSPDARILFAATGAEALAYIESDAPDLLLTDLNMPGMDGLELIERMRGLEKTKRTPAILISGADHDIRNRLDQRTVFLQKPMQFDLLRRTVEQFRNTP